MVGNYYCFCFKLQISFSSNVITTIVSWPRVLFVFLDASPALSYPSLFSRSNISLDVPPMQMST